MIRRITIVVVSALLAMLLASLSLQAQLAPTVRSVECNHGQQFMTMYMHLSKIVVTAGQHVRKGQFGLSGATGRVTRRHLHMAAHWQDRM